MPVVTPNIANYKPFYIQKEYQTSATNTLNFGMVAKSNPYPLLPSPKDPYKNDWKDADGDDEYTNTIYYKAFEFSVSFYVKATESSSNAGDAPSVLAEAVEYFFEQIKSGTFMVYDAYTGIGFSKVRYAGYSEDSYRSRGNGSWARAIFSITFKVLDPMRHAVMEGNKIVDTTVEEEDE